MRRRREQSWRRGSSAPPLPIFLLVILTASLFPATARAGSSGAATGGGGGSGVTRIDLLETMVSGAATNVMTLLLTDETPFATLRAALRDMSACVARSLDEDVPACVPSPAHWVAAHLLVLTDVRTWVSPPDADDEKAVVFSVIKRRLAPRVRTDQCGETERPSTNGT